MCIRDSVIILHPGNSTTSIILPNINIFFGPIGPHLRQVLQLFCTQLLGMLSLSLSLSLKLSSLLLSHPLPMFKQSDTLSTLCLISLNLLNFHDVVTFSCPVYGRNTLKFLFCRVYNTVYRKMHFFLLTRSFMMAQIISID